MKRIKQAFVSLGVMLGTITTKAFDVATLYGVQEPETMYGVMQPENVILELLTKVGSIILIPIVAIIGLVVYLKKKKK